MAALSRVVLVLLICWVQRCSAQDPPPSTLNMNPTSINLTPNTTSTGTSVTVSCSPPGSAAGSKLFSLNIKKKPINSPSTTPTLLVQAELGGDDSAELKQSMSGASATGSVNERVIRLVMSKASCSDEALYFCDTTYSTTGGTVTAKSEAELKAEVAPGQLTITVNPSAPLPPANTWKVNDTLTMSCDGPVGSVNTSGSTDDPRIGWQWEFRDSSSSWSPYSGNADDIKTDNFRTTSCYKMQRSTLTLQLTLQDSGRQYRCYIRRGLTGFQQFADTYTVGTVTTDGIIPPPVDPAEPVKANVGAIVGGVFASLIAVVVIIIIIFFVVIRPRRRRQAEEDFDGVAEKGDDKDGVPPNAETGDPAVVYSQPHRRPKDKTKPSKDDTGRHDGNEGVVNKALDDSGEKNAAHDTKLSPDNDDKRHGRRHKDKKQQSPYEIDPQQNEYDPHYAKLDHRDPRQDRNKDKKPASRDKPRRHHDDPRDDDNRRHDDNRRGRHPRDADNYDEQPARYDDGHGRRNRGYEYDNRRRGHHSSSDDGGNDSFVNTSQYSMGDGDPSIGTAI